MVSRIRVDLARPPDRRWAEIAKFAGQARKLTGSYVNDLGGLEVFASMVAAYRAAFVSDDYAAEIDAIAKIIDRSPAEVLVANLYYMPSAPSWGAPRSPWTRRPGPSMRATWTGGPRTACCRTLP